jgi:hypothetical protein
MAILDSTLNCGIKLARLIHGRKVNGGFESVLAIFLDGSVRTLSAIKLLHDNGFYEEGLALSRILLEIVVDLGFIKLKKDERALQFIDFGKLKANEKIDLISELNVKIPPQDKYDIESEFKNKMRWSQISFEQMLKAISANKEEVGNFVLIYKLLCGFSHSSTSGLGSTTVFSQEDIPIRLKHREDLRKYLPILSCNLVLCVYVDVNKEFSLGESEDIELLKNEIAKEGPVR